MAAPVSELEVFRLAKDEFFMSDPRSPLTLAQRKAFVGLEYFPEEPDLVIVTDLDTDVDPASLEIPTTTGDLQVYRRAGLVRFTVVGLPTQLTLFAADGRDSLFVPFRDATSGDETYGGGRYLDVEPPVNGRVVVDLNLAYNPWCAYNPSWSCPLPPPENQLVVPIRAGELTFEL